MRTTIKKTVIVFLIMLFIVSMSLCVERPPELTPKDVPFVYDPNLCPSAVLDWIIAEPNISFIFNVGAHNKWGLDIELTTSPIEDIFIEKLGKFKDPNEGWNQYWNCACTLTREGVHYLELIATDKVGRRDCRTLLILCASDEPPFLFTGNAPVILPITKKDAQKFWQYAKKQGHDLTKPTKIIR